MCEGSKAAESTRKNHESSLKSKRDPREAGLAWKEGLEMASRELLTTRSILVREGHQVGQNMLQRWGSGQK